MNNHNKNSEKSTDNNTLLGNSSDTEENDEEPSPQSQYKKDEESPRLIRPRSYSLFVITEDANSSINEPETEKINGTEKASSSENLLSNPSYTLPKQFRPSRKNRSINTLLLEAVKTQKSVQEIERYIIVVMSASYLTSGSDFDEEDLLLLIPAQQSRRTPLIKAGANPNATCSTDFVSACHLAAMRQDDALSVILSFGADKQRSDRFGRTPLHFAAYAGNMRQIAILLGFSKDLHNKLDAGDMIASTEEKVRKLSDYVKELVNVKCAFGQNNNITVPKDWRDNPVDHNCKEFGKDLPIFQPGWSALHAASAYAQARSVRLLLAAGADPCARDLAGRTPLDVAGIAYFTDQYIDPQNFAEVVKMLLDVDCKKFTITIRRTLNTTLHTAVEIGSLEAVTILVQAKVPVNWLNLTGLTPLHMCVQKKLKEHLQVLAHSGVNEANIPSSVDVKDKNGNTVLHQAVVENWEPGVSVALEFGASITAKNNKGETPIHLAAAMGNVDILIQILNIKKETDVIDTTNNAKETPLFNAVNNGHTECVKILLKVGASIEKTLPKEINVFHKAAEKGFHNALQVLLDHDYSITRRMVNYLTADDGKGYGPIHFAVQNNHPKCVKMLLSKNAYRCLRTSCGLQKGSTPLHIAALTNNVNIAKIIMKNESETVHSVNDLGWTPLHTASHHGSRDVIILLLKEGADLSASTTGSTKCKKTAIHMIMDNLSKPTEFMESLFDTYISTNHLNLQDPNCEITVDYKILVPESLGKEQMKVVNALLKTGNRYGQSRLLVHPLLESFLYLKWKTLLPFFYTIIAFYALFVMSLTIYIISVFFYEDMKVPVPNIFNSTGWELFMYVTICVIVLQELLYMNVKNGYFFQLETWVKFTSLCLSVILPYSVNKPALFGKDWPRHIATGALLSSWLELMFLLSRFPNWGYYVLMFAKVSANVIKILLTFAFLLIGFSLAFMIQFHSQEPFESPWAAFVKTMVMMTSEFDYEDLMKQTESEGFVKSLLVVRLVFFIFLIFAAIVLMNLMVGVAVNDLYNLQVLGNVRRLGKQVEFLGSLESLGCSKIVKKLKPNWLEKFTEDNEKVMDTFVVRPNAPNSKNYRALPSHVREAIFEKAQQRKKQIDDELGSHNYRIKIDKIFEATVIKRKQGNNSKTPQSAETDTDLRKEILELHTAITNIKNQTQYTIGYLNTKMDIILNKLENNFGR